MLKINFKNNKIFLLSLKYLFLILFILFIVFSFFELLKPRIITNYLDLNVYLLFLIFLGVITVLFQPQQQSETKSLNFFDYFTIFLFSVLIGLAIYYFIQTAGFISILVGIAGSVIAYFFIILTYKND